MKRLTLNDIYGLDRYEREREEFRRHIIELKKRRRLSVGDDISFVFENRETVLFQIQEMMRAERITDLDKVREELDCYNELIPEPGDLSTTMLIEITEQEQIRPRLVGLIGIDRAVRLRVGDRTVPGEFEPGRSKEDNVSAVQYVRFHFDDAAREQFRSGTSAVELIIDHPNYRATAPIEGDVRAALALDLGPD